LAGVGVLFTLGIVIAALAGGYWSLIVGRFVMGVAVGAVSAAVPTYLGEMAPAQIRGRILALNQLLITIGLLASYIVNWVFAGAGDWRLMFWMAGIPGVILVVACILLPESPVWLIAQGRSDEARRILDTVTVAGGADRVIARFTAPTSPSATDRESEPKHRGMRALMTHSVRPALFVGLALAALQQFSGINTILYYAPTIMEETGLSASNAIFYSVFIGVINVAMTVVSTKLVDRLGRRPLLLTSLAGMAAAIALLGAAFALDLSPVITLVFMLLYIVSFAIGMGPVFWVLLGEIFPTSERAVGSSSGATVNWTANFVVSLVFLPLLQAVGEAATFWIFAAVCLVGIGFVAKWVPETRGRHAEEIGEDLHRRWNLTVSSTP
ncbi:MAG: sugar porter family MFS transporter, partial [Ilumatobacteraceae bacterium]